MSTVKDYFNAEKFESLFFIAVGVLAIGISVYHWFVVKESYSKGMAVSLSLVACIQLTVGFTVYLRSPKDIIRVENILKNDPTKIQTEEIPRMEMVMKNFIAYRYIEIALIIVGLTLFFLLPNHAFWKGLGLGLLIQAALMLLLDFFAESRGSEYLTYLKNL